MVAKPVLQCSHEKAVPTLTSYGEKLGNMQISTNLIAIGANGTTQAVDWSESGTLSFAAGKLVALSRPLV